MGRISRVGDVKLQWGESVRWDDRRDRLYFVDCGTQTLHWLDGAEPPLRSLAMPTIPTGVVLTEDDRVIVALGDGLYLVDPDGGRIDLVTEYPEGLGGRANDARADLDGNLVTGTLNLAPGPGSYWWYSASAGWRKLDDGINSANGPVVLDVDGDRTLVFGDTHAQVIYAYDYDGKQGIATNRRAFADTRALGGSPDGACADDAGGIWGAVFGGGKLARYTFDGRTETIVTAVEIPSDVTFGGPDLDRLFFTSLALSIPGIEVRSPDAGAVMVVDDTGYRGRPEPRFRL